jgi:microsomal dipeptidase-like Zn-dependent dipeptidase
MRALWISLAVLALGAASTYIAGSRVEGRSNRVAVGSLDELREEALALHRSSVVVDLHADSLLMGRDLLERSSVGHVDLPRLREGGVALQVFSINTRVPRGFNIERTHADRLDLVTLLALSHLWPPSTFFSLPQRALYQARRLEEMAARSEGYLRLVRNREDLEGLLRARSSGEKVVGGLLAIEGAHALGTDFRAELDVLFGHGLRMVSLTHFFDNDFGGSVNGLEKGGLTPRGRELVAELERRGIVIDLAHASAATFEDVLEIAQKPVVVSHTGVNGTCGRDANLSDDQIRGIAAKGGVIGIGFWDTAVCGTTPADIVRAMRYVIDLVGEAHLGLGSDFDGFVTTPIDASGLPSLTQAMLDADLDPQTIRRILGANLLRVLDSTLPPRPQG